MSWYGVAASPGRARGPVVFAHTEVVAARGSAGPAAGPAPLDARIEASRIRPAADLVEAALLDEAALLHGAQAEIARVAAAMATDRSLLGTAEELVTERHRPAPRAVFEAAEQFATRLSDLAGAWAERVPELLEVRDRIIAELTAVPRRTMVQLDAPSVLIAVDLTPTEAAALDPQKVLALVCAQGSATSHTAVVARSLGIPAVMAVSDAMGIRSDVVWVDGDTGIVESSTECEVQSADLAAPSSFTGRGRTLDGVPVAIVVDVGSPHDVENAADVEGVGLLRTEFCYMAALEEPSVEQQRALYAGVLRSFHGKPVVVRTLDAGADKPLTTMSLDAEPNPALGVRGLRAMRADPGVLDRQLRAILGAGVDCGAVIAVVAPMVSTPAEARWFAQAARSAGATRVGVMIEVPAAALCSAEILAEVDFVSIGTEELTQYTMAADRDLAEVARYGDPWQPAVLRLIDLVCRAGRSAGKPVGVCGNAAADPLLACVFVGLGAASVSMDSCARAAVGARLREHTLASCRAAAVAALNSRDAHEGRAAAQAALASEPTACAAALDLQ